MTDLPHITTGPALIAELDRLRALNPHEHLRIEDTGRRRLLLRVGRRIAATVTTYAVITARQTGAIECAGGLYYRTADRGKDRA